jgi:hypothetical protein
MLGTEHGTLDITSGPFTFAAWGNVQSSVTFRSIVARRDGTNYQWQWRVNTAGNISLLRTEGAVSGGAWPTGVWAHGAVVVNADGSGQFFLNGAASGAAFATKSITHYDIPVKIGNALTNAVPWLGFLSDVCVWGRALSAAEIQQLADPSNAMLSGLILPPKRRLWAAVTAAPATPDGIPVFGGHVCRRVSGATSVPVFGGHVARR